MKKSVVIVSLILLLVLTGLGGWWFFAARQSPEAAGGLSKLFESAPPQASFIDVNDLIITLQGENGRERYLLLDLVLVVRGEEHAARAMAFEPAVRSATVGLLNNQPYAALRARQIPELHDQLLKKYREDAARLGVTPLPFEDVMISKMVFQ